MAAHLVFVFRVLRNRNFVASTINIKNSFTFGFLVSKFRASWVYVWVVHTLECLVSELFMSLESDLASFRSVVKEINWVTHEWMGRINKAEYSKGELILGSNLASNFEYISPSVDSLGFDSISVKVKHYVSCQSHS